MATAPTDSNIIQTVSFLALHFEFDFPSCSSSATKGTLVAIISIQLSLLLLDWSTDIFLGIFLLSCGLTCIHDSKNTHKMFVLLS